MSRRGVILRRRKVARGRSRHHPWARPPRRRPSPQATSRRTACTGSSVGLHVISPGGSQQCASLAGCQCNSVRRCPAPRQYGRAVKCPPPIAVIHPLSFGQGKRVMLAIAVSRLALHHLRANSSRLECRPLGWQGAARAANNIVAGPANCSSAQSTLQASTRLRVFPARAAVDALPAVRRVGERPTAGIASLELCVRHAVRTGSIHSAKRSSARYALPKRRSPCCMSCVLET